MSIKYSKKKFTKLMYNYKKNEIDEKIKSTLYCIYESNNINTLLLNDAALILKLTLKEENYNLKYNGKVRNILSYIRKEHKNISNFIRNNTNLKLDRNSANVPILSHSST